MRHLLHRRGIRRRSFRSRGETLLPTDVMVFPTPGDQRFDVGCSTAVHVGSAQISVVGEQFAATQLFGKPLKLQEYRCNCLTSCCNCASIFRACSYEMALCRLAFACSFVPSSPTVPSLRTPMACANFNTSTNSGSISPIKCSRHKLRLPPCF
jgi:hypothetical protein